MTASFRPSANLQSFRPPAAVRLLKSGLFYFVRWTGLMPVVRVFYSDHGAILMFHEIHDDVQKELMTGTSSAFLDRTIRWLKRGGWKIVRLDEFLRRAELKDSSDRFVVLSFDDGYRDTVSRALPILESHNVPLTVYVPTGALTRDLYSWWLGLRQLVRTHDSLAVEPMNQRFECANLNSKIATLEKITRWVHTDFRRTTMLKSTFTAAGLSFAGLNESYFMDEQELKTLAKHPLAEIGAHTTSHQALSLLDADTAYNEMTDNRAYLENLIQRPVQHFAYPYGNNLTVSRRDVALAAKAGFLSAVTSQDEFRSAGPQFKPWALPRTDVNAIKSLTKLDAQMSGLQKVLRRAVSRAE